MSRRCVVLAALAMSLAAPGRLEAEARELASPFRATVASPTALPPSPGPGFVAVTLEADDARHLFVRQRRRGQIEDVCEAPCARWLAAGSMRLGVGDELAARWWSEPIRLRESLTIELRYVDNALTRALGFVALAASLVTLGATAFDFLDMGPTDPPIATTVVSLATLAVSFGLFFVGDGVDIDVRPE